MTATRCSRLETLAIIGMVGAGIAGVFGSSVWPVSRAGAEEQPHWGHTGEVGPSHWGDLSEDFVTCKTGKSQSPIDIVPTAEVKRPPAGLRYFGNTSSIVNNGHAIQINVTHGNSITVEETDYQLRQFHFHTPAEHRVRGEEFPLEAHFVHKGARGELAVVAILFREGAADASIEKIVAKLPTEVGKSQPLNLRIMDFSFFPYQRAYYRYDGSLTTPPCTEGVRWFVLKDTSSVSAEQVAALVAATGKNARPVQPLNGRSVTE